MKDIELNHWLMLNDSKKTNNKTLSSFAYLMVVFIVAYIATLVLN